MWARYLAAVAILFLLNSSCSDDGTPTEVAEIIVEVFSGSFGQQEASVHNFKIEAAGDVQVNVLNVEPLPPRVAIGVGIGLIADDGGCSVSISSQAAEGGVVLGTLPDPADTYCVVLFDIGNVAEGEVVTYEIEVLHF